LALLHLLNFAINLLTKLQAPVVGGTSLKLSVLSHTAGLFELRL
jgi:hypothetical protein